MPQLPKTHSPVQRSQAVVQGWGHDYIRQKLQRLVPSNTGVCDTLSLFTPHSSIKPHSPTRILHKSHVCVL